MAEPINLMKDRSGIKEYYYDGFRVIECPFFVYEVTISEHYKNGYSLLSSCLYKSDNYLKISRHSKTVKKGNSIIEKATSLVGVTKDFIIDKKLTEYDPNAKFKRVKKKISK